MTRTAAVVGVLLLARALSLAQAPSFEAVSIKRNASGGRGIRIQTPPDGGLVATNTTLGDLIRLAYRLREFQLDGGPAWLNSDRFDVVATGNGEPSELQVLGKVQRLLGDRFRLRAHTETREMPIYALVVNRRDGGLGSQLRRSPVDCAAGPGCGIEGERGRLVFTGQTAARIAEMLTGRAGRTVVDRTGLEGSFDATLTWAPETAGTAAPDHGPSLFTAVVEQLGLRLDPQRGPVPVLVVDAAEQPTEN